ncbi:MAG: two-component system sensor histidine kinase/response regulator [Sulfurimonas sp.]|jgi:two-component system sensor histidine kinase/response regulator
MNSFITLLTKLAKGKAILLVEDEKLVLENLQRMLSHFFKTIYKASDVDEALKIYDRKIKDDVPIVVITDINLGKKTGIDLIYTLKKINPDQKVIAISGTEDRDVFIESIRCGVDRFVLKPINQDELFNSLVSILQKIDYDLELKESRKLLEDSKEYSIKLLSEQDQFLKNAIHEIHTPLAVIITNIDLLRLQGNENESLNSIEAGARIIQNSYEDMTYLMKHDRITEHIISINSVEFIRDRINYFNCIAKVNELSFSLRTGHPNLPNVLFSELKLSRLVDNTLSNAIKYSKRPSEISVTIGLQKENIFFEVRNYGPVILDKKKIFERFYREEKQKGGYGIGLSIVGQICQEEDVAVQVSSTLARGTSFRYIFKNGTNLQHNCPTITKKLSW